MRLFIYPYQMYSKSVHGLREKLNGVKVIKTKGSNYKHTPDKMILNWGSASPILREHGTNGPIINPPEIVRLCSNKKRFFQKVDGFCSIPDWTDDPEIAEKWAIDDVVIGRMKLTGHSGEGIVFSDKDGDWLQAKIWTRYIPKKEEYRVHVMKDSRGNLGVIDIQQKKLQKTDKDGQRIEREFINWRVRSHKNGFIYARKEINPPVSVTEEAIKAVQAVGIDFGAVDIIWNEKRDTSYVLEINTAPGLTGQTLDNYVLGIQKMLDI